MAVFLSSAYIHSELHSFRASSALHTNPLNLQCVTLYQNPDRHYKKENLQFDISWDQSYSKKKRKFWQMKTSNVGKNYLPKPREISFMYAMFNVKVKSGPCHQHEVGQKDRETAYMAGTRRTLKQSLAETSLPMGRSSLIDIQSFYPSTRSVST